VTITASRTALEA
jgi:nicotinamide mononucleotide adenylyltransferase